MPLKSYLKEMSRLVDDYLNTLVPENALPYSSLFSAARYSLLATCKRLRPVLLLAVTEALGTAKEKALSAAAAIEIVHTYSLIHDDLPCMDDDDFRRGIPSLHKKFSEAHAVLTGDFLLSFAFELLAEDQMLTSDQKVKLISLLAKGSGGHGMVGGQIMDIEAEGKKIDLAFLQEMHQRKTGQLITTAVLMGGVVAKANDQTMSALKAYGDAIGLAFQIMDDVLDIQSSLEKHGSHTSSDLANNKTTYATLMGLTQPKIIASELVETAILHLQDITGDTEPLKILAKLIIEKS